MKRKILGIFVCTLLFASIIPVSTILAEKIEYKENPLDKGWKWISSYPNYAPSGMPDFDETQGNWKGIIDGGNGIADSSAGGDDVQITIVGGLVNPDNPAIIAPGQNCALESFAQGDDIEIWMFSSAVSTMNCFWWFDSRYGDPDGYPGDGEDIYPLVKDYGAGDDHIAENAPLSIEKMANALNITSTIYLDDDDVLVDTIDEWFVNVSLEEKLDVNYYTYPTFEFISGKIESNRAVILVINFIDDTSGECVVVGTHYVACTGVNFDDSKIAFCDPSLNKDNPSDDDHNDTQYVSQDRYVVEIGSPCSNMPDIEFWLPSYMPEYNFSVINSALVIEYINNAPGTPTIDGPTSGNIGTAYNYTFNSIDPDSDDVYYYIEWGDGLVEKWDGPHASGTDFEIDHTYTIEGTFTIKAKARDPSGEESDVAELEVTMPRNKPFDFNLMHWLLEHFPNAYSLLKTLLGFQ